MSELQTSQLTVFQFRDMVKDALDVLTQAAIQRVDVAEIEEILDVVESIAAHSKVSANIIAQSLDYAYLTQTITEMRALPYVEPNELVE
jgi:hypothetical protein